MKKNLIKLIAVFVISSTVYGCGPFLIGSGVAGSVILSVDTVRLRRNITYEQAWSATQATLEETGEITFKNEQKGIISAKSEETEVAIEIIKIAEQTTAIDVKARKKGLPNLGLAESIADKINDNLKAQK